MASQYVLNSNSLPVFFITVSGSYISIRMSFFFLFAFWSLEYIDYLRLDIYAEGSSKIFSFFFLSIAIGWVMVF